MTGIEVLVSTMNRDDLTFIEKMKISTNAIVVNQNGTDSVRMSRINDNELKFVCSNEKGLSRSRNLALKHSKSEICVLADDDVEYVNDYSDIILQAYNEHENADIIVFQVERTGCNRTKKFRDQLSWENYITSLKISSVEITFKRDRIIENGIKFNELMGAGSEFYLGEENIFLYDSLKKGLKVLYLPIKIASVDCSQSSWFEGYTKEYFNSLGAAYYNMSKSFYSILLLQFALRKYKLYKDEMSFFAAYREMVRGVRKYKKLNKIK
ncbi:glycosyltransferase [Marinilactibacillus psychrotolerans]|uniref:glycosyltransferase family A protein n=1 Tax=Marinilactibacillus psychrotolerans TaxID=191770 RepID=UPI003885E8C5